MQLSKRLEAVAGLVTEGHVLVDVGCDHAYLPVWLIEHGRIPRAIATDVRPGPLARAEAHVLQHRLSSKITLRLSDGLAAIRPAEGETLVLAGMGGPLMERILTAQPAVRDSFREIIAQPQSEIPHFRRSLAGMGWEIRQERIVLEDGKYYPMMRAVPAEKKLPVPEGPYTLRETFGGFLLEAKDPVLYAFLKKEEQTQREILEQLSQGQSLHAEERRRQVEELLARISEAYHEYENTGPDTVS